ncbi:MAG TPA: ATP-binding protein, partial [Chromatiaceae bacterium]|nr:ATP-binding protein [Chromatiaceae bacterium]
ELEGAVVSIDDAPDGQKGESGYIRFPGQTRLAVDHFGDGTRHAFKALASLIALAESVDDEHPGLFLWEDPELFMHPATLGSLLREAMKLVQGKPIQVFMSTQSLDVVASLTEMLRNKRVSENDVMAFRLALSNGSLRASWFDYRNLITWLEEGKDPRFWMQGETLLQYRLEKES